MRADYRLGFRDGEEYEATELPVEGDLPEWLSGVLLRNGPGRFSVGDQTVNHWFDGFATLRRFAIRDGRVEFATRVLRSDAYEYARARGDLYYGEFGTTPDDGTLGRLRRLLSGELTDNASITVTHRLGEFVAITEPPRGRAFDSETLTTLGVRQFDDDVDVTGSTAHRHYDPECGETWGLGTRIGRKSAYVLHRRRDGKDERTPITTIPVERPAYVHSFALTERYAVVTVPPYVTSPRRLLFADSFVDAFEWHDDRDARFYVIERETGDVATTLRADPFFTFHHANAFERDDEIVLDCVAFDDASAIRKLSLDELRSVEADFPKGELCRYRLPLGRSGGGESDDASRAASDVLYRGPMSFPSIDYAGRNGRPYRYVYGAGNRSRLSETYPNQLVKVDVATAAERDGTGSDRGRTDQQSAVTTWHEPGTYPGEPLFVPAPESQRSSEDDGVALSVVLDADAERSFLLVLDAATFEERARATAPGVVPFGFHGQFYRDGGRPIQSMA